MREALATRSRSIPIFTMTARERRRRSYCVYIVGSLTGTLYIGFTGNLHQRVFQHKFHELEGFTARTTSNASCTGRPSTTYTKPSRARSN